LSLRNILTKATIKKGRNNNEMITMTGKRFNKRKKQRNKEKDKVAGVHRIVTVPRGNRDWNPRPASRFPL
jgi:hypothetical protein